MLSRNSAPAIPYFEVDLLRKMGLEYYEIADRLQVAYGHRWWPHSLEYAHLRGPRKRPSVERRLLQNAIEDGLYCFGPCKGFWKWVARHMGDNTRGRHFWTANAARLAAIKFNMVPEGLPTCRRKTSTNHSF